MTNKLAVRGIYSFDTSCQLAVLAPEPENPFWQLLAKYTGLTHPNFSASIPPHDVVHHIRTTGPPVFSRTRRLASSRLSAAKAEFEHMLRMGNLKAHGPPPPYGRKGHHCPSKCVFGLPSLEFLIHLVDSNDIQSLPSMFAAIRDFTPAASKRQLRRFLAWLISPACSSRTILPLTSLLSGPKVSSLLFGLYAYPYYSLLSGIQRDGRAVSPPAEDLPTCRRRSKELDTPPPLVLLGTCSSLKSDLNCSVAELVFGATVRLPGLMISLTPRVAVEDPTNLLHRLRYQAECHSAHTADRRCSNSGLILQAVNTSPTTFFGTCSRSLEIGIRRHFAWVFVVVNIPCTILGAEFLVIFDLLVDGLDSNDIQSLPSMFAAIRDFTPAASKRQLRRFLAWLISPACSSRTILPLTSLLSGPKGGGCPGRRHPPDVFSPRAYQPISLMVDASNVADLAIETIELLLQSKYDETENRLGLAQILHLLKHCLRTYFTFDGKIYKQVKGTPMGSPISGFIAEAVLQRLESLVFQHHKPKFWARYVDDTFVVIERDQVLTFQEHLNVVFPDIQFTMEEEENNKLAFWMSSISLLFCQRYQGASKIPQTLEVLPASVISQVQSLLANSPADAPYSALKAEILRLNSVSDRQQYHQLIKEESLGDRKPSDLLRRMRSLLGDMQVDDKFVKEMFLERLPADVQTILASGSQDLTVSQLAEMADRMIEVQRFQSPSVAQISSSSSVNDHLVKQVSAMADEMASLKMQLARLTFSRSCNRRRSRSRPRAADTCWYHTNFGLKTRKPVSQRIDATVFSGSSGSGRTFYVCDTATRRRFLVDTGAQISVVPPTAAERRFPSPGLHLQAANCSPIPTFGSLSLTLNIGLRRSFTWIFVIAAVPHAILGSDFLAEFDLLVDCRRARLLDRTTGLFVRGLTPFTVPTNLSVLDTDIASPFRQLLLSHPNIINPQFRSGEVLPCLLDRDD
ncbi:hypothetical protein SprV_0200952300 [Sparganum proliferum]